jgi:hybrid cluster-associated redox disulfide protein
MAYFWFALFALAQRGNYQCGVFLLSMDTHTFLQDQITVEEVLRRWPETWVVFKRKRTHCVGCFMQRFCSLQEVADAYRFPVQDLIEELENVSINPKNLQGVSHENPL